MKIKDVARSCDHMMMQNAL